MFQDSISRGMSVLIIVLFEVIKIEKYQAIGGFEPECALMFGFEHFFEMTEVK